MELGGNAPFIIFNDANIEKAVNGLISCKYRNAGQTCVSANRIYVQSDIHDEFAEKLLIETKKLIVGNGIEKNVNIGPLIDENALIKIRSIIDDALSLGAKIILGGKQHKIGGLFYEPTILINVNHDMLACKEEIFGPIAALIKFDTEEEVIYYANNTEYGLASYCYTKDLQRTFRMMKTLEFGMIGINSGIISNAAAPFGGIKNSGIGREGSHHGLNDYLETKYILLNEI